MTMSVLQGVAASAYRVSHSSDVLGLWWSVDGKQNCEEKVIVLAPLGQSVGQHSRQTNL